LTTDPDDEGPISAFDPFWPDFAVPAIADDIIPVGTGKVEFTATGIAQITIDFDVDPSGGAVASGTVVNALYSSLGVTFEKLGPGTNCGAGPQVYANGNSPPEFGEGPNNVVSVCAPPIASDFSENTFGRVEARFVQSVAHVCIDVRPPRPISGTPPTGFAFLEAFDAAGAVLGRNTSSPGVDQTLCITATGIRGVRFAGAGSEFARFDNLLVSTEAPPID